MAALIGNDSSHVFDIVGVGFGPSNLALAIAVTEYNEKIGDDRGLSALFLDENHRFHWHDGMLIRGATVQIGFLKDLVTLRNPISRFSFLNYLHEHGRLCDFINHKTLYPSRMEFKDYLAWAAQSVVGSVRYGTRVVGATPVQERGRFRYLDVSVHDEGSAQTLLRARNVVLATGGRPRMPDGISHSERIWHSSQLLHRLKAEWTRQARRFTVIGAGQSAAEVTAYLHDVFPEGQVNAVFSRFGYTPADSSPFANRVFDPASVDAFHNAPESVKNDIYRYHNDTNYSVVDSDLIDELYRRSYQESVAGYRRLNFLNMSRVLKVDEADDRVTLQVESLLDGTVAELESDVVVYATGYDPMDPLETLPELTELCGCDKFGRPRVNRDYGVVMDERVDFGVYLQGGTEHTHGLTSSLLSNIAVRSGEIVAAVSRSRDHSVTGKGD